MLHLQNAIDFCMHAHVCTYIQCHETIKCQDVGVYEFLNASFAHDPELYCPAITLLEIYPS